MAAPRAALQRVGELARTPGPVTERAAAISETIRSGRGYRWVGLYLVTAEEISVIAWTGPEPPAHPRFPAFEGLCGAAVASRAPVVVGDVARDPRYLTTLGSTRSEIVVPVLDETGAQVSGLIDVESERANAFGQDDIDFLSQAARLAQPLWDAETRSVAGAWRRGPQTSVTARVRHRPPDPVSSPAAYQKHLLGLLGADDPAGVQAETPAKIRALLAEAAEHLRARPDPLEWSVLECVGHIVDAEMASSGRYRWILAHDEPPLAPYDQDRWVDRLRHNEDDVEELLSLFEGLRRANLYLWSRTPVAERSRVGIHAERGPESYELTFRLIAGHDRNHLAQAHRTLETLRGNRE